MKKLLALVVIAALASLCACGGGGGAEPTGTVSGTIEIGGPIVGGVPLTVGLFTPGSDNPVDAVEAGHLLSAATGVVNDRTLTFSFTELALAPCVVRVYAAGQTANTFYYTSDVINLSAQAPSVMDFEGEMSFSGAGPWGSFGGVIAIAGDWPAERSVYIGVKNNTTEGRRLQWYLKEADVATGQYVYYMDNLTPGDYTVGLYGYNGATHQVDVYGEFDTDVAVEEGLYAPGISFVSNFEGDPGVDALGSIAGVITLNGDLADGPYFAVAANTIPPQPGPPTGSMDVDVSLIANGKLEYIMSDLPYGEYAVSIFIYDTSTHQATYFGEYDSTVVVDVDNLAHTGIDFDADVSIL